MEKFLIMIFFPLALQTIESILVFGRTQFKKSEVGEVWNFLQILEHCALLIWTLFSTLCVRWNISYVPVESFWMTSEFYFKKDTKDSSLHLINQYHSKNGLGFLFIMYAQYISFWYCAKCLLPLYAQK